VKKIAGFFLVFALGCPGFGERSVEVEAIDGGLLLVPTFDLDIAPLLEAKCVSCHGATPQNGAPLGLRLDRCESRDDERAASELSERILARIRDTPQAPMPPSGLGFNDFEIALFENWNQANAPCDEGAP